MKWPTVVPATLLAFGLIIPVPGSASENGRAASVSPPREANPAVGSQVLPTLSYETAIDETPFETEETLNTVVRPTPGVWRPRRAGPATSAAQPEARLDDEGFVDTRDADHANTTDALDTMNTSDTTDTADTASPRPDELATDELATDEFATAELEPAKPFVIVQEDARLDSESSASAAPRALAVPPSSSTPLSAEERERAIAAARLRGQLDELMYRVRGLRREGRGAEADRLLEEYWRLAGQLSASSVETASPTLEVTAMKPSETEDDLAEENAASSAEPVVESPRTFAPPAPVAPSGEPHPMAPLAPAAPTPHMPSTPPTPHMPPAAMLSSPGPHAPSPHALPPSLPRSPLAEEHLRQAERRYAALNQAARALEESAHRFAEADYPDEAKKIRDYAVRVHEQADQMMTAARRRHESQQMEMHEARIIAAAERPLRMALEQLREEIATQQQRMVRQTQQQLQSLQEELTALRHTVRRLQEHAQGPAPSVAPRSEWQPAMPSLPDESPRFE